MRWSLGALVIAVVAAGCGGAIPSSHGGPAAVRSTNVENGRVLVDGEGHALYLFEKDEQGESYCTGACAAVWPPYETEATPQAIGGLSGSGLGTTERPDGDLQVTYDGHPLYYYAADASTPGNTRGEGVEQFGAEWYLVGPDGKAVEEEHESGSGGSRGEGGGYR